MREARAHRILTAAPDDVAGLRSAIAAGRIDPKAIVAILGKTEGNGCVNDFTRAFSVAALKAELARHLPTEAVAQIAMVMSGGTEGALSPHLIVLEVRDVSGEPDERALAVGCHHTPPLPFSDLGRFGQIQMVAEGVKAAMTQAGITDPADVHFVQIKCPLLTADRVAQTLAEGRTVATRDTLKSMGLSRGASALGVALALGEIDAIELKSAAVGSDTNLWSGRASTSGGVELLNHEIVVLGMAEGWTGRLAIDHAVMADQIDVGPVLAAFQRLGLSARVPLPPADRGRLVALLAKAEAGASGQLRGSRHTMLDDSDISSTRHARAFVAGALAALVGHAQIFVSGGAEHQGPDGGGPVAIIAERGGTA